MASVNISMNQANIHAYLHSPSGPVHRRVSSVMRVTQAIAVSTAPVNFGRLKNTSKSEVADEGSRLVARVWFTADYALFVHEGTGVYGPRGRKIVPKTKKALSWVNSSGDRITVRSVRGMRPRPWLVQALKTASPWPVRELS